MSQWRRPARLLVVAPAAPRSQHRDISANDRKDSSWGRRRRVCAAREGMDDSAGVHEPAGRPSAQSGGPALAEGRPGPPHRRAEEADLLRGHPEVLPRSGGGKPARQGRSTSARATKGATSWSCSSAPTNPSGTSSSTARYLGQLADPRTITAAQAARDHRARRSRSTTCPAGCTAAKSARQRC